MLRITFFAVIAMSFALAGCETEKPKQPPAETGGEVLTTPLATVALPAPVTSGGMPINDALALRCSQRKYSTAPLTLQQISNLLWAANGINRKDGKRTAPSTRNWQAVDIYVVLKVGAYLYEPAKHKLTLVQAGDFRAETGLQPFVEVAPLNLVYVADGAKMKGVDDPADKNMYGLMMADTGCISENVYLYCASQNWATVVRGMINKKATRQNLKLNDKQFITLAQTVGLPAEK